MTHVNMSHVNTTDVIADDVMQQQRDGGLLILTMNRPANRNALDPALCDALVSATSQAAADPDAHAVMLTGAGPAFCVGGDVKAMASGDARPLSAEDRAWNLRGWMEASRQLHDMRKPTIAAINGAAAGAGLSLALACDLRIATRSAKITTAFAKVALSGDYGGTYFLTRLLGSAKARELYFLSPVLSADEALRLGIVNEVVDDADFAGAARAYAKRLSEGPRLTLGYIKQNINMAETSGLEVCFDTEAMNHVRSSGTADHREAAAAFVEKRQPRFRGA